MRPEYHKRTKRVEEVNNKRAYGEYLQYNTIETMISAIRIDPNIEKTMISIVVVLESELVPFVFSPSEDFKKKLENQILNSFERAFILF